MRTFIMALLLTLTLIGAAEDRFNRMADQIVKLVNSLDADGLYRLYDGQMRDALPAARTKSFLIGLQGQFGRIEKVESSKQLSDMTAQYRVKMQRGVLNLEFALDAKGKIAGLFFKPAPLDMSAVAEKPETKLQLPFKGQWLIFWGGDTEELGGHHLQAAAQRFAFDILGVGADGKTRKGDGGSNEDY